MRQGLQLVSVAISILVAVLLWINRSVFINIRPSSKGLWTWLIQCLFGQQELGSQISDWSKKGYIFFICKPVVIELGWGRRQVFPSFILRICKAFKAHLLSKLIKLL